MERVAINGLLEAYCISRECPRCLQPHFDRLEMAHGILHAAGLDSDQEPSVAGALDAALRHYMWGSRPQPVPFAATYRVRAELAEQPVRQPLTRKVNPVEAQHASSSAETYLRRLVVAVRPAHAIPIHPCAQDMYPRWSAGAKRHRDEGGNDESHRSAVEGCQGQHR